MATRRRSEPMRYQIRNDILELLTEDGYKPGDKIPTENELMEVLNVSRSTLREGLHLLEEEHILRTRHGTGRFLVSRPSDFKFDITRLQSVTEMLADYGIQVTTKVLSAYEAPADNQVAEALHIAPGTPVISIERIRYADKVPVICAVDIIPRSKFSGPLDPAVFEGSFFKYLEEKCGLYIIHTKATIRAIISDSFISRLKVGNKSVPWLLFEQVNFTISGEAIVYSKDYHRGDYITFHVNRFRHS